MTGSVAGLLRAVAKARNRLLVSPLSDHIACRAGTTTTYHWGDSVFGPDSESLMNWSQTSWKIRPTRGTMDVGQFPPNPWGFYDMLGNVREYVNDYYEEFTSAAVVDPQGPPSGTNVVIKSGSFEHGSSINTPQYRSEGSMTGTTYYQMNGFRIALKKTN